MDKFDVRVVSPANHFLFTPLLPSTAVGTLEFRAVQEPIRTIEGLGEYYQVRTLLPQDHRRHRHHHRYRHRHRRRRRHRHRPRPSVARLIWIE